VLTYLKACQRRSERHSASQWHNGKPTRRYLKAGSKFTIAWMRKPASRLSYRLVAYACAFLVSFSLSVSFYHLGPSFRLWPNTRPPAKSSPVAWFARAAEVRNAFRHAYFGASPPCEGFSQLTDLPPTLCLGMFWCVPLAFVCKPVFHKLLLRSRVFPGCI
jgi:hypothetical protein